MKALAKNLFDRRYDDLVAMGRSRIPGFAPEWTDHNAHDPGITLMEVLGFVAEAQLHSLSRMRRDERAAYAALMGVQAGGVRPARGILWPDDRDLRSPWVNFTESQVIGTDAVVRVVNEEAPLYHPSLRVLWVPASVTRLIVRDKAGRETDLTAQNRQGSVAFRPFGANAGPHDVLRIELEARGAGLLPKARSLADGARFVLGVRAADGASSFVPDAGDDAACDCAAALEATLVDGDTRTPLDVVQDTTAGLLRTGVLALDVSEVAGSPQRFAIELRSPGGFVRPPRWLRVTPSVLPIVQRERVLREPHDVNQEIDFAFRLDEAGLCVDGHGSVTLQPGDAADATLGWKRCERLEEQGPADTVFELDEATGRIRFGNGVNGRAPRTGSPMFASYAVSFGEQGNAARNRRWHVDGFEGAFGVNPDPIAGGAGRRGEIDRRRAARAAVGSSHALVTETDLVRAAHGVPLLGVARAWVVRNAARPGLVTLVALRERDGGDAADVPEAPRWLRALRRALSPRVPLGSRLVVAAPRYTRFGIRASIEVEAGRDPEAIRGDVLAALEKRLALVPGGSGTEVRQPGVPLGPLDAAAWIRAVPGVAGVRDVRLVDSRRRETAEVRVGGDALPRFDDALAALDVRRAGEGR